MGDSDGARHGDTLPLVLASIQYDLHIPLDLGPNFFSWSVEYRWALTLSCARNRGSMASLQTYYGDEEFRGFRGWVGQRSR